MKQHLQTLLIDALEFEASIGVFEWEKQIRQLLVLSLEAEYDAGKAAESDQIDDAISYVDVSQLAITTAQSKHYELLEHLANVICDKLMQEFPFTRLELSLMKPGAVPQARNVGVRLRRER